MPYALLFRVIVHDGDMLSAAPASAPYMPYDTLEARLSYAFATAIIRYDAWAYYILFSRATLRVMMRLSFTFYVMPLFSSPSLLLSSFFCPSMPVFYFNIFRLIITWYCPSPPSMRYAAPPAAWCARDVCLCAGDMISWYAASRLARC